MTTTEHEIAKFYKTHYMIKNEREDQKQRKREITYSASIMNNLIVPFTIQMTMPHAHRMTTITVFTFKLLFYMQ